MENISSTNQSARASARAANTLATFRVVPSGAALGAEIQGVDFSLPVPEEVKEALRRAWADHMVLLVRGQQLTDDHLLDCSGIFGPPHAAASRKYHLNVGHAVDDSYLVSKHASITIISNLDAHGKPVMDNGGLGSYEVVWQASGCSTGCGHTPRSPATPGPTSGKSAISCYGTTAAACTTAPRWTSPSGA